MKEKERDIGKEINQNEFQSIDSSQFLLELKNNKDSSFKNDLFQLKTDIHSLIGDFLERNQNRLNQIQNDFLRENIWKLIEEEELSEDENQLKPIEDSNDQMVSSSQEGHSSNEIGEFNEEERKEEDESEHQMVHHEENFDSNEEGHSFEEQNEDSEEDKTFNIYLGLADNPEVEEKDLIEAFKEFGEIVQVNIFKEPKKFGFVHFKNQESQEKALQSKIILRGKSCKFSKSEQRTVLFIGNLPHELNQEQVRQSLQEIIGSSLPIQHLELKTKPPPANESRGFCFVKWSSYMKAYQAKKILSESKLKGQAMNISWAENRTNATQQVDEETMSKVKTLYVSDIPTTVSDSTLRTHFIEFGEIINCSIVKNGSGESRGFAFVEYKDRTAAENALSLNGKEIVQGNCLSVQLAKPTLKDNEIKNAPGRNKSGNLNKPPSSGKGKTNNRGNLGGGRGTVAPRGNINESPKKMGNQPKHANRGKNTFFGGQGRGTKRPRFGETPTFGGNLNNVPHSPTSITPFGVQAPPFPYNAGIPFEYHQPVMSPLSPLPNLSAPYSPPIQAVPMIYPFQQQQQQQIYSNFYPYQH